MYNLYFLRLFVKCNGNATDGINIVAHTSGNQSCLDGYEAMYYECVNGNILCFNHDDLIFMIEKTLN